MLELHGWALALSANLSILTETDDRRGFVSDILARARVRLGAWWREPHHAQVALIITGVALLTLAGMVIRGEAGGVDTQAYWAAGRLWLTGGDPYHPSGALLPYVYAPWQLPLFVPWALLPWNLAWFLWRALTILGLLASARWAYVRRPKTSAILLAILAFPIAVNLDTGNINLPLALLLFGAQFCGPLVNGLVWMAATTIKWVPALIWPFMSPSARRWGLVWLIPAAVLTIFTWNETLIQISVLLSVSRPPRLDYLVFLWALVPWAWRHPEMFRFMVPSAWPEALGALKLAIKARRTRTAPR